MAVKKSELYSTLWEGCNKLRGSMDASQYKNYVLIMLFLKYISDKAKAKDIDSLVEVPAGCTFDDIIKLKHKDNIGEEMNKILKKLLMRIVLRELLIQQTRISAMKINSARVKIL